MPGDNVALSKSNPKRYFVPVYVGPRGLVALRLDVGRVDWEEFGELVTDSYGRVAPKGLATLTTPMG